MRPEAEFVLQALEDVVQAQPPEHPLWRVDRDNSEIYDGRGPIDMTEPMHKRKGELEKANFVGVAWESRSGNPVGTDFHVDGDIVASVRLEGMRGGDRSAEFGHIDPTGLGGVVWTDLYEQVRGALLDERTYPDHESFRDVKLDLRIANETDQSSNWRDFYRADFDVVFWFREDPDT